VNILLRPNYKLVFGSTSQYTEIRIEVCYFFDCHDANCVLKKNKTEEANELNTCVALTIINLSG